MRTLAASRILVAVLMAMLSGCGGRNVVKGDADYPRENPTPRRLVTISGAVPPELDISFKGAWKATANESCSYVVGASAPIYYSQMTDLEFSRNGGRFTLPVPIDKYISGRCNWTLSIIELIVSRENGYPSKVGIHLNHARTSAKKMDVWCTKSKSAGGNEKNWGRCLNFKLGGRQQPPPPTSLSISEYDLSPAELNIHYEE